MKQLLKLEMRKLKKQKSFYICTLLMIALLFLSTLISKALESAGTAYTMAAGAVSGCSFLTIAGIFVALLVCDDYEQQTIKNIYSRGYSRKQVYFSKYITAFLAVTVMFVLVTASAFQFGKMYFGTENGSIGALLRLLAVQYVICMANMSFFFALAAVLRKNGASIAAVLVAPMLVNMILTLADSFIKSEKLALSRLWISSFLSELSSLNFEQNRLKLCLAASLLYIPFFLMIGFFLHKKKEC